MEELRIAVVGAGTMGRDHIRRISARVSGASVAAIVEPNSTRGASALEMAPGARLFSDLTVALETGGVDALVVASPAEHHEAAVALGLERALPVLCEKPLAMDAASVRRIVDYETKSCPAPLIQVGFQRRFDAGFLHLRDLIRNGDDGRVLALHMHHRSAFRDPEDARRVVLDLAGHDFDSIEWLLGERVVSIDVRPLRAAMSVSSKPAFMALLETESGTWVDLEVNPVSGGGYQVGVEAVFENGTAAIERDADLLRHVRHGRTLAEQHAGHATRFASAYDQEVQRWVDSIYEGHWHGPTAWDSYRAALLCDAALLSRETATRVAVSFDEPSGFYLPTDRPRAVSATP